MSMSRMNVISDFRGRPDTGKGRGLFSGSEELRLLPNRAARARILKAYLGPIGLGEVVSTGHDVQVAEYLATTVLVPVLGRITTVANGHELSAQAGEAIILPPGKRMTHVRAAGLGPFRAIPVIIPTPDLRRSLQGAGFSMRRINALADKAMVISARRSADEANFIRLVCNLHKATTAAPTAAGKGESVDRRAQLVLDRLASLYGVEIPNTHVRSPDRRARYVSRATEYMHTHFADIQSIVDVAEATGISVRMLELAFQSAWGVTPQRALSLIRLQAARRLLSMDDGQRTVTAAALECGFNHLGRFSAAYRAEFGELPSHRTSRS